MDEQKTLILSLEFDTDQGLQRAAAFRSAIDADKASLQELNATIKENGKATEAQALQREKLEQSIRANTKSRSDELRAIDGYLKASKAQLDQNGKWNGSIKEMRGALAYLTEQWNGLSREERENAKIGGVLQQETKRLSDQLKELEGSVGDNRRSVGGYLDAIRQAPGAMGKFRAGVDGISTAMKANPLGLLVSLLPTITALFNSSGDSADFFAKIMQQINAVIEVGMKYLVKFGGYAVDMGKKAGEALSNPKQVLNDLIDFIKNNVANRFKAFGVIIEGIKNMDFRKVTDGAIQLGTGVTDATGKMQRMASAAGKELKLMAADVNTAINAGGKLAEMIDTWENAESKFQATSSKTRLEIQQLIAQSKNRTLSEKERIALLDKADKMEIALNKQAIKLAEDRMKIIKEENKQKQGDEDEELKRVNEQQEKINELRGQSLVLQEKLQARKDALLDAAAAKEQKRIDDEAKAAAEAAQKKEEFIKLIAETGEKEYQNALKSLDRYLKEQSIALKNAQAEELSNAGGNKEAIQKINERYAEAFGVIEEKRLEAIKVINTDYNKETIDQEAALAELKLNAAKTAQNNLTATEKKGADERTAIKNAEYAAAVNIAGAFNALGSLMGSMSEEMNGFAKATALFQIGVSTAIAIAKAVETAISAGKGVAEVSGPAAVFTGPAATIATFAALAGTIFTNIAQAKSIIQAEPPKSKAADGGLLQGPSHAAGGITGTGAFANVEVEGGEAIINKRSTAMYSGLLNIINQLGGGKPLGATTYAAAGGILSPAAMQPLNGTSYLQQQQPVIDYGALARAMASQPVYVRPTEIVNKAEKTNARKASTRIG